MLPEAPRYLLSTHNFVVLLSLSLFPFFFFYTRGCRCVIPQAQTSPYNVQPTNKWHRIKPMKCSERASYSQFTMSHNTSDRNLNDRQAVGLSGSSIHVSVVSGAASTHLDAGAEHQRLSQPCRAAEICLPGQTGHTRIELSRKSRQTHPSPSSSHPLASRGGAPPWRRGASTASPPRPPLVCLVCRRRRPCVAHTEWTPTPLPSRCC